MTIKLPDLIEKHIDGFTGRTWLLPPILRWYDKARHRCFVLTGGPGTGKSMIMAWLAGFGPPPDKCLPNARLRLIRDEVKAVHFCAASGSRAPKDLAKGMAEQLTGEVDGFADALRASLADMVTITTTQKVGKMEAGASSTGVRIGTLKLGGLSEELSFNRTLRDPLKILYEKGYDKPMLLLVDALDEAATYTGAIDIVELLTGLDDIPDKVRLLVTTRPEPKVMTRFHGLEPFDLIADAPQDTDDVRDYAYGRLYKLGDEPRRRLSERLAKASEGNFLYAQLVLDDLLPRLEETYDLDALPFPSKLPGLYHRFLLRVKELDPDKSQWYDLFGPVLGLIAVSQDEGLTKSQLDWLIGQNTKFPLRRCGQFLQGEIPGPFRIFHKSFADYLLEDDSNVNYHLDAHEMHTWIANRYWGLYGQDGHDGWMGCDRYGLKHLPLHQSNAGQRERLRGLLFDFDWLQAKLEAIDVATLLADFDLLPGDDGLETLRGALQLAAHVLARDKTQLAGQLLGRLLAVEQPDVHGLLVGAREYPGQPLAATHLGQPGGSRWTAGTHSGWTRARRERRDRYA